MDSNNSDLELNAKDLKEIATKAINDNKNKITENAQLAANKYHLDCVSMAKKGYFSYKFVNLVKQNDNTYFCQTDSGGEGFTIYDLDQVITILKEKGYNINSNKDQKTSGYIDLEISWG